MAQKFFNAELGITIDGLMDIIPSAGLPGLTAASNDAPIGSEYTNTADGKKYLKITAGSGTDKWAEVINEVSLSQLAGNRSWRKPVIVVATDAYANLAAAESDVNTTTVDGITVSEDDRILFTNITGQSKNVFIIVGTPGAGATLVEDTLLAVDGDVVTVKSGTNADDIMGYTGTAWASIGGGSVAPDVANIIVSVDLNGDGTFNATPYSASTYLSGASSVSAALLLLDGQVDTNATAIGGNVTSISTLDTFMAGVTAEFALDPDGTANVATYSAMPYWAGDLTGTFLAWAQQIEINDNYIDAHTIASGATFDATGAYVAHVGTNFLDANTTLTEDLLDLDTAMFVGLADKLSRAGDSMDSGANLLFVGGGEALGLPATPSGATASTSKAYVDALVSSSTTWQQPIECPNFVGVVAAEPVAPVISTSYVKFGGTQAEAWTGLASVSDYDIVEWNGSIWEILGTLESGIRFGVQIETDDLAMEASLYGAGVRAKDLIEYVSGDPTTAGAWIRPHESDSQALWFGAVKVGGDASGLTNDATVYNATVDVDGSPNIINVTGSAAQTFTTLIAEINTDLTGATASMSEGHIHITNDTGGVILIKHGTGTDLLASITDFIEIRGSAESGTTVLARNPGCAEYGHTYLYSHVNHDWTEIGGPGAIGDGVGLTWDGNILNVNIGAGITELPSDKVGLDIRVNYGLFLTVDGTTPSTHTASQLAIQFADTTISKGASGIQVNPTIITKLENVRQSMSLAADGTLPVILYSGTNYLTTISSLLNGLGTLDAQIFTNEGNITTLTADVGTLTTNQGNIILGLDANADGSWNAAPYTALDNVATSPDLPTTLYWMDTVLTGHSTSINSLTASDDDADIRAFIGKGALGAEMPAYVSAEVITQNAALETAISELDAHLARERTEATSAAVSTTTILDSVLVDDVEVCKWLVSARQGQDKVIIEVLATHDGDTGNDATDADYTKYAKLRMGHIGGWSVSVDVTGVGAAQEMRLIVDSSSAADFSSVRQVLI